MTGRADHVAEALDLIESARQSGSEAVASCAVAHALLALGAPSFEMAEKREVDHEANARELDERLYGVPDIYTPPEAFMPRRKRIAEILAELYG